MPISTYQLLARFARARCISTYYQQFAQEVKLFTTWSGLPTQAEAHGLGPLLYVHLQAAGVEMPPTVKQALQGLYLRHRRANQVRMQLLADVLTTFEAAGITVLVLKGAALAHLIYPQPGLRAMRDLDLLVEKSAARQAQELLAQLGFRAPLPNKDVLPVKHLAAATRPVAGLYMSVEIHHNLFGDNTSASMEMKDLTTDPISFSLGQAGLTAYTLGYEDMLWHLCQHLITGALFKPIRLIGVADIVSFTEHFLAEIDWKRVKKQYPLVLNILSSLHRMTPLSDGVLHQVPLKIGPTPSGIGVDFQGWPTTAFVMQRKKGYRQMLSDTFFPSEWWLRLYYGLGSARPLWWHRWVWHPFYILSLAGRTLLREKLVKRIAFV